MATCPSLRTATMVVPLISAILASRIHRTFGMRMRQAVNLFDSLDAGVGVNLCCGNAGMSQHFLHHSDVGAFIQHMSREAVPEGVRCDVLAIPVNAA
jgi:hypothetical protein